MGTHYVKNALREANNVIRTFLSKKENIAAVENAVTVFTTCLEDGGKIISCGNGGSMCDAMHFAEELSGKYKYDRPALPALSLSDPSYLTCVANDYGFEQVFSRGVEAYGSQGDVLLAISTSGNSPNVIKAVEAALKKGMKVVGLSGRAGGDLALLVNVSIVVESYATERIQEMHTKLVHIFIEGIEREFFPGYYIDPKVP